jgi:hypothetical protein
MERISRGFRLAGASWEVVKQERELLVLPLLSFLCSLVIMVVFALGAFGVGLPAGNEDPSPLLYVLGFVMYVALSFVTIYFNAAVIGIAMKRLDGQDATLSDGLSLARRHVGKIFVWAVLTATVGMVLRAIQERAGILGRLVVGLVGVAWNLITFFVVPVLLYEPLGVGAAIKRSSSIFKARWGEQVTGNVTIGLAMFLIAIPVLLIGGLISAAVPIVGIPLLVVAMIAIAAVGAALSGVFNAALYRYATTGRIGGPFSEADLVASFRPKRGTSLPPAPGGLLPPPPPAA